MRGVRLARLLAFAAVVSAGSPVQAQQQRAIDRELVAAGFIMRPADTPDKRARLRAIPPHRFAARTSNGQRYYIYADPDDCVCAFVGTQKALDTYRDMVTPPSPPPGVREFAAPPRGPSVQADMIHEMNEDAGLMESDLFHLRFN